LIALVLLEYSGCGWGITAGAWRSGWRICTVVSNHHNCPALDNVENIGGATILPNPMLHEAL